MFQQNKYEMDNRYIVWLNKHFKSIFINENILTLLTVIVLYNLFGSNICYFIISILMFFNYYMILLINLINKPIEMSISSHYKRKASKKLQSMPNMQVIGITGSYGKTSSKNILYDILNSKYNAYVTPKNYNTISGLMLTINNYLDKFNDYFIAEMGATKKGEIKMLCDFVHPKYGIITRVGIAHLETFKTEENILNTKFELIESLPPDGVGILNGDDEKQLTYKLKNNCRIIWIGIDNHDVDIYAKDIKLTNEGTTFKVYFKKEKKEYEFQTVLLGKANLYNILAGIALGNELGITYPELKKAIKNVKPVPHRLEKKLYYDINLIDDSYNNNPLGSKMAIDVLKNMPGKKMIITSGMIELGEKLYEENYKLGKLIAESKIDEVILIGKNQTKPIYEGLKNSNYNLKKVHVLNDILEAFKLIRDLKDKDTYVLLQSDLPDLYKEKNKE